SAGPCGLQRRDGLHPEVRRRTTGKLQGSPPHILIGLDKLHSDTAPEDAEPARPDQSHPRLDRPLIARQHDVEQLSVPGATPPRPASHAAGGDILDPPQFARASLDAEAPRAPLIAAAQIATRRYSIETDHAPIMRSTD